MIRLGVINSARAIPMLLAVLLAAGCLAGCRSDTADDAQLAEAWRLCKAENFAAASPLLRDYLVRHPDRPVAHFLLGKCFANRTPVELTRAKGEFDMARYLLETGHYTGVPGAAVTSDAFLADTHYETALVLLHTAMEAYKAGIAVQASVGILKTALEHADKGLQVNPASPPLTELKTTLERAINQATQYSPQQPLSPPAGNAI
jgi:hypothetical protein